VHQIGRQKTEGTPEPGDTQGVAQGKPAGANGTMGENDPLGTVGSPRGEQDQGIVIEPESRDRPHITPEIERRTIEYRHATAGEPVVDRAIQVAQGQHESGTRHFRQLQHFERGQMGIHRADAGAQSPDRHHVGHRFQSIAVAQENPVAARHPGTAPGVGSRSDLPLSLTRVPASTAQRLDHRAYRASEQHRAAPFTPRGSGSRTGPGRSPSPPRAPPCG
jgi:hypothetical protein